MKHELTPEHCKEKSIRSATVMSLRIALMGLELITAPVQETEKATSWKRQRCGKGGRPQRTSNTIRRFPESQRDIQTRVLPMQEPRDRKREVSYIFRENRKQ